MPSQLILIAHVVHPAVTQGFVPAAIELGYEVTIMTDHGLAHREFYSQHSHASLLTIMECDVFNPIAIIDELTAQAITPDVVMSNSDHLQAATALVAEYYSLPCKPWTRCYESKNKAAMRQRLQHLQIPSVTSSVLAEFDLVPETQTFPVVVKPREGVGSMGVALCANRKELEAYRDNYYQSHHAVPLMLEDYMQGSLFSLETLSDGETIVAVGGFDVELSPPPHFVELCAVWNGDNGICCREEALDQLKKFGIGFGACHSEFIVTASGPRLVEINYRSIGDGSDFFLDELLPEGWFKTIIKLHAGEPLAEIGFEKTQAVMRYIVADKEGCLTRQQPLASWDEKGIQWQFVPLKHQGEQVRITQSNKDYIGILVATSALDIPLRMIVEQRQADLDWGIAS